MDCVNDLLQNVPIPKMVKIRQNFDRAKLTDVKESVYTELNRDEVKAKLKPGMKIAITAGSRGISNLDIIIKTVVDFLKEHGALPFVIPAMGSHGGASAQGQLDVIAEYNITEQKMGCPVIATTDVVKISELDDGRPVYINRLAAEADGIISLNRIKAHTAFRGKYESGVMKMLTIGLGCQKGAEIAHRQGILNLGPNVEKIAFKILENANIILGVGIIENAYDETLKVRVMTGEQIPVEEPKLLDFAKSKMSRILFDKVDVLIVDYIGKNISGEGMDPNVAGRWIVPNIEGGIDAARIGILDLTPETLGNFVGLGMADTCSKRVIEKISTDNTYPNSLTSTVTELCKIPMFFDNHKKTIQATIKMVPAKNPEEITMIRIKSTLDMDQIEISENLIEKAKQDKNIEILSSPYSLAFNKNDDLF